MPRTDLKLTTTNISTGAKQTTSIPFINASASSGVLLSFARQLNRLTTNTYGETNRVQTINVDTEEVPEEGGGGGGLLDPNMTLSSTGEYFTVQHDGNGTVTVYELYSDHNNWDVSEPYNNEYTVNRGNTIIVLLSAAGDYAAAFRVFVVS